VGALELVSLIFGLVGAVAGIASILKYNADKRGAILEEGKKAQELEQVKKDLADARTRVDCLEKGSTSVAVALAEIKTLLDRVIDDVKDLGKKLDDHARESS